MFGHSTSTICTGRNAICGVALIATALATIACERSIASVPKVRPGTIDASRIPSRGDSSLDVRVLPDPALTPGDALNVTARDICVSGYSKKVRDVPSYVKRQAYNSYGIRSHAPGEYEIDHLINLSLGGSNSIRNLWPESFRTSPWNAYVKDQLEVELHRRVCAGTLDLVKAQQVIAHNWITGYREYVHPSPLPAGPRTRREPRTRTTPQFQTAVP